MTAQPMRLLFVKESQDWPRVTGHDVHAFHMMQALIARGHAVSLATIQPMTFQATAGLNLEARYTLESLRISNETLPLTSPQRKFAEYFGVEDWQGFALAKILEKQKFDAVIVVARHLLPLFAAVNGPARIWYPADDPAWHHFSRIKVRERATWGELGLGVVNALYERSYRPLIDRIWVVSPTDRRAARWIVGCGKVDVIPNGVDANYYAPGGSGEMPNTAVFWGRLDFGPNYEALEWFLKKVWPAVQKSVPEARFDVFGFNPTPRMIKLAETPGVKLYADLTDLRTEVRRRQVVVLPFVSGGGIKNKLLEAAAMGMPIVCSKRALSGLKGKPAVIEARTPKSWCEAITRLWKDESERKQLGTSAREWVTKHHTWAEAAADAEAGLRQSVERKVD